MRCSFGGGKSRKAGVKSCVNWYDYGARMYDPALGRWHVPEPLSFFVPDQSVYSYVGNNPISFIDEYGMWWPWKKKRRLPRKKCKIPKPAKKKKNKKYKAPRTKSRNTSNSSTDPIRINLPNLRLPSPKIRYGEEEIKIEDNKIVSFDEYLTFMGGTDKVIENDANEEILLKLLKTMHEYPRLRLILTASAGDPSRAENTTYSGEGIPNYLRSHSFFIIIYS